MTGQLDIVREGNLGIISLDRPEAINALSMAMIEGIFRTLSDWAGDAGIRMVLFEGKGSRGFCAGGDVRAARAAVLAGRPEEADAFFAAEYRMNGLLANYPKPLVAITHGATMGGGIGIAGHCDFRFVVEGTRYAMPEAAIGFVCDVGVNAILNQAQLQRALLFLLSGASVGPADALALGLGDVVIAGERVQLVRAAIATAAGATRIEDALRGIMDREAIDAGEAEFCTLCDRFADGPLDDVGALVAAVIASGVEPLASQLTARSPTSLAAIHLSHLAARKLGRAEPILALDLRLARYMARQPDFAEGVRAVLVDKDQSPKWAPARLAEVDGKALAMLAAG